MKRLLLILIVALCLGLHARADEPQVIPTTGSWSLGMKVPGMHVMARPVRRYDINTNQSADPPEVDLLIPIMESIPIHWVHGEAVPEPNDGFAVAGTGIEALQKTYDVLVDKKPIQKDFPKCAELSLVIRAPNNSVEILSATRADGAIEIKYVLPYFKVSDSVWSGLGPPYSRIGIALIPVGKLPAGTYSVSFSRVPYQPKPGETVIPFTPEQEQLIISRPFVFNVKENEQATPPKTAARNE